jgi:hypothetical protein
MSDEFDDVQDPQPLSRRVQWAPAAHPLAQVPRLIAEIYAAAAQPLRARLLECLLRPVGPLALAGLAAGAFGAFLHRGGSRRLAVSLDDAARISAHQVLDLAGFVAQIGPESFQQVAVVLADNPIGLAAMGGSALVLLLRARGRAPQAEGAPAAAGPPQGG